MPALEAETAIKLLQHLSLSLLQLLSCDCGKFWSTLLCRIVLIQLLWCVFKHEWSCHSISTWFKSRLLLGLAKTFCFILVLSCCISQIGLNVFSSGFQLRTLPWMWFLADFLFLELNWDNLCLQFFRFCFWLTWSKSWMSCWCALGVILVDWALLGRIKTVPCFLHLWRLTLTVVHWSL